MQKRLAVHILPATLAALCLAALPLGGCTTTLPQGTSANAPTDKTAAINSQARSTLDRLYRTVPGSQAVVERARGVLVFPSELSAGFIVGAAYGEGVLLAGGQPHGYYRSISASLGPQIGAQSRALVIAFMNDDALRKFEQSPEWTVGVDATVAVAKIGANGQLDSSTFDKPVVAFTLTNVGLMAGVSLQGTRISRLNT
jgi:lipid-binding SYLF domain-containing protein